MIANDEARAVVLDVPRWRRTAVRRNATIERIMNMYKGNDLLIGAIGSLPLSWLANRLPKNLRLMVVEWCGVDEFCEGSNGHAPLLLP